MDAKAIDTGSRAGGSASADSGRGEVWRVCDRLANAASRLDGLGPSLAMASAVLHRLTDPGDKLLDFMSAAYDATPYKDDAEGKRMAMRHALEAAMNLVGRV